MMYRTGYLRKAAVKLFLGLSMVVAVWGSGSAANEKLAEASGQPGTPVQTARKAEPTNDSGQGEKTDPDKPESIKVSNTPRNLEPVKGPGGRAVEPTQLLDFRVGTHDGFTRIVLDSSGARPLSIGPPSSRGISIRYAHLDLVVDPERSSRRYPSAVATASYEKEEKEAKILITFRQPDTRVKTSFLGADPPRKGFYRLVMDLYPPQRSIVKEVAGLNTPEIDVARAPEGTGRTWQPAPGASPNSQTEMVAGESERSGRFRTLAVPPEPGQVSAQLQETDPNGRQKAGEAPGQKQEIVPLEVTPRPAVSTPVGYSSRYLGVSRPRLGLGLSYEFQQERREGRNVDTTVTSNEFKQRLAIETSGWAYHPALCTYTLRFDPEWSQVRRVNDPGESSTDTPFEPYYAVDAYFLEPKPYTLHGFADRREIKLRSAFTAVTDTTIDTYGGDLRLKYRVLPTFLKYTHTNTDQSGFFDSTGERDDFQLASRHVTSQSTTTLTSNYSDSEQTSGGVTSRVKTFSGDLGNAYDITGNRRKTLSSNLSYRWTESDFSDSSFLQLREDFFWRHTDKLYTDYLLALDTSDSNDFDRDTGTFRAKLQHLLYENLTTTAQAGALLSDSTGGRQNVYDANLDFFYQRNIPWGAVNLRADFNYRLTERAGFEEDLIQISNEEHVLTASGEFLDNPNVDLSSVVVISSSNVLLNEGGDYVIDQIDSFALLRLGNNPRPGIVDSPVRVNYRYLSEPDFDDSVFGQTYNIQLYLWNALTLGYGYRRAKQDIISGTPPQNPIDDTGHTAEIRLNLGWTDTRFTYGDTDRSSSISTTRWLASQTFRFRPQARLLADVTGFYGWTDFKDSDQTQKEYGASGRLFWTPAGWCRLSLEGFWTKISGDLQDREDINITGSLELTYRIWRGGIYYRFSDLRNEDQKQIKNELRVEIIRILW